MIVQSADDWRADWLVRVAGGLNGAYYVEYLLPAATRPWPAATVRGEAATLAEAERYLLVAMRESQGWAGNAELAARLGEHGLTAA